MRKIIKKGGFIKKSLHSKADALLKFKKNQEIYKLKIIEESDQSKDFQIYTQEDSGFIDLCKGPHLPSPWQVFGDLSFLLPQSELNDQITLFWFSKRCHKFL